MVSSNPLIFSLLKIQICCAAHRQRARSDPEIDWLRRFSRTTSTFSTRRQSSRSSSTRRSASSSPPTPSSWMSSARDASACKFSYRSYFIQGLDLTTVFSHSQTVVVCPGCQTVLCQPTGGKARLTEGCSFRRKGD
ncbi:40S ribosomal protein S27 [Zea mays]|uniref:40S ribosomal protein S27 n=1 Tax=Zea mays TaxID=4577 RepID=A0A3L6EHB8_MAIZE|nr:40S ribosomal protein S27 [Zea mays]